MQFRNILVTGGAGFVGSSLALNLRRDFPDVRVAVLDNLKRRGSEFNLPRLRSAGVEFFHGDTRSADDIDAVGSFDLLIDCAAEPSVQAGLTGSPRGVFDVNLNGTINCLEAARRNDAAFLFLSTSRVYPMSAINAIPFEQTTTRFRWTVSDTGRGVSSAGISEEFPLTGARSYYGASKLASELIAQEYAAAAGMRVLINRCGVLTGPWQMGKVDQGVVALWVLRHHFGQPLKYIGYEGTGLQVRDLLHVDDLYRLLIAQCSDLRCWDGTVFNVGGGERVSVSLRELTDLCRNVTERRVDVAAQPETSSVDLRIFLTDSRRVQEAFDWQPELAPEQIVSDIHLWIRDNETQLRSLVL
ncbi:MAG: NAD-dependent epimerase/dehydratase family protein [Planctomycetaceae bacterium]